MAAKFGAHHTIPWLDSASDFLARVEAATKALDFHAIFEFSGAPAAVERACEVAAIGARIVLAGTVMPTRPVSIDPEQLVRRCVTIVGVHNYAADDLLTAVDFLSANYQRFPFESLVSRTYRLTDIDQAIEYALQDSPIRVAICPAHSKEHISTDER